MPTPCEYIPLVKEPYLAANPIYSADMAYSEITNLFLCLPALESFA
jgi:hypothetical protein